jgi:Site-specific recombinase XerD
MRVRESQESGSLRVELLDGSGEPVEVVCGFLRFLAARDCSPNTLVSYAYDLRHLWPFFASSGLTWERFGPPDSIALLEYLRSVPSRRPRRRMTLSVVTVDADGPATKLAASTVNRILAAVSSFYEYTILSGLLERANPLEKRPDLAPARVSERHRPFMGRASRQRPVRRAVRVKTVQRVPRPLPDDQVQALLAQLRGLRDKAIVLLMLHGGLRPAARTHLREHGPRLRTGQRPGSAP